MNRNRKTIRSPQELLEAVPHVFGFHPTQSMVAVVMRGHLLHVTARWDLDIACEEDGLRWIDERLSDLCSSPEARVLLVGYGHRRHVQKAIGIVRQSLEVEVVDALIVDQDRWWFADEEQMSSGRSLSYGLSVPMSREDIAASIASPKGLREDDLLETLVEFLDAHDDLPAHELGKSVVGFIDRWSQKVSLDDRDYLDVAVAISEGAARDEVWKILTHESAKTSLGFWKEVLRRTPVVIRVPVLAVTGMVAWIAGEGTVMNICLKEAEALDPNYPLVVTLSMISHQGLHSSKWLEMNCIPLEKAS